MRSPRLRMVAGGLVIGAGPRSVSVQLVPADQPLGRVDAVVLEEDTHLVLSAPVAVPDEPEHPVRVMTALIEAQPARPGNVIVKGRSGPLRFLAVVHDVEQTPTWREEWVRAAVEAVVIEATRRRLRTLAVPVLAAKHGSMSPLAFARVLRETLLGGPASSLETLYLLLPPLDVIERRNVERELLGVNTIC